MTKAGDDMNDIEEPDYWPVHPATSLFPMMSEEEYVALREDIRENGQREPAWLYEGQIIDGRNRLEACRELGIKLIAQDWDGQGSLTAFIVSLNLKRRHLNSSQRAVIALEVEKVLAEEARQRQIALAGTRPNSQPDLTEKIPEGAVGEARDQAAAILNTNSHYITDAKKVAAQAPELLEQVRDGKLSIPEAKRQIKKCEREAAQQAAIASVPEVQPWAGGHTA